MQLNGKVKRATFQKLFFHTISMTTETRNVVIAISQAIATPAIKYNTWLVFKLTYVI
jgi:hypothetical protein